MVLFIIDLFLVAQAQSPAPILKQQQQKNPLPFKVSLCGLINSSTTKPKWQYDVFINMKYIVAYHPNEIYNFKWEGSEGPSHTVKVTGFFYKVMVGYEHKKVQ